MKKLMRILICLFLSICTTIAIFVDVDFADLEYAINGWGVSQLILCGAIAYGNWKVTCPDNRKKIAEDKRLMIGAGLLGGCFSLFMVIGNYMNANPELKIILLLPILMTGYFCLFAPVIYVVSQKVFLMKQEVKTIKVTEIVFERHPFLFPFLIIMLGRVPYLVSFFPCTLSWDGAYQIGQQIGLHFFNDEHPPFMTLIYGVFARWGIAIGNPNGAMFVFVLIQTLLTAGILAFIFVMLKKMKTMYALRWILLLFYSLFTVWSIFSVTIEKDSLYYAFTVWYLILLLQQVMSITRTSESIKWYHWTGISVIAVIMSLIKYNGIYVFVLSFPFLIFLGGKKYKLRVAACFVITFLMLIGINRGIMPMSGVYVNDTNANKYGFMIQQTARYLIEHEEDVTPEEYEVLNRVFDYQNMKNVYNPYLTDLAKDQIRVDADGNNCLILYFNEYRTVWLKQFTKHPTTYINSFLNSSYGYFYPNQSEYKEGVGYYSIESPMLPTDFLAIDFADSFGPFRNLLEQLTRMRAFPLIGMLYSCGIYTWIVLWSAMLLIVRKHYFALIGILPVAVNILICLIAPVNPYIRYAMPTMAAAPILIGWAVYWVQDRVRES